jgi:dihydroorotate dehydrogenase (NAD+) catalytic subunit
MVWQVAQAVKIPIIGMGGIMTAEDALQFMMAGATAIAIGSGTMVDPMTPIKVIEGLEEWLIKEGIADIKQIIGAALPGKL